MRVWTVFGGLLVASSAFAGMTLNVDSMTVNGFEVRQLSCEVSKGGLFASAEISGAIAAQKSAFDACVPSGAAYRIKWQTAGGTLLSSSVEAGSNDAKKACIGAALKQLKSGSDATCSATILVGEQAAATAAADALKGP